jgi:hypothetical protein
MGDDRRDPPGWAPPIWAGCDLPAWLHLLARHRFAVERSRWRVAAAATIASLANSALGLVTRFAYDRRVTRTPVPEHPVFVLGHWRSGTTLLHELLAADPRHAAPTTYQCFAPSHALLTRGWLPRLLGELAPTRQPVDRVAAGWDRPQEDEFALALLGLSSPYERIAFPNRSAADESGPPGRRWERTFVRLVRTLTFAAGGRGLVLKSPPHTARVPTLVRLFPDARFVHLARDPYAVYPSALRLWRALYAAHALQRPAWGELPEFVLGTFERMHRAFEDGRAAIPSGHLVEIRYENLVRDPVGQLDDVYRGLGLGDFEPARPGVEVYLARNREYEPNAHVLTADERAAIARRWAAFIEQYGYAAG